MTLSLKLKSPVPEFEGGAQRAARPLQKRAARTRRRRPLPNRPNAPTSRRGNPAGPSTAASGRPPPVTARPTTIKHSLGNIPNPNGHTQIAPPFRLISVWDYAPRALSNGK